ncbi:MAG TPA: hypothetical protein VGF38_09180 [Ktedonobacterales bacterium]
MASPVLLIVSRLGYLLLALCILLGELQINMIRAPAVLGLPSGGVAPGLSLDVTSALLFLSMAAFFGSLALEFLDVVPAYTHLFPTLPSRVRRIFLSIALVGLGLSVLCVGALYAAGAALLEDVALPGLSILINLLQGILLTIIAVPALWALTLGIVTLIALICAALWLALTALAWLLRLLAGAPTPDISDDEDIGAPRVVVPGKSPSLYEGDPTAMSTFAPLHILAAIGAIGRLWLPRILNQLDQLGGGSVMLAFGLCDPLRPVDTPVDPVPQLTAADFSPTPEEIEGLAATIGHDQLLPGQMRTFAEKLKDVVSPGGAIRPQLVAVLGMNDVPNAVGALVHWKQRYPDLPITLFVVLPEPGHETADTASGRRLIRHLWQEGIITVALILDPRSPLARSTGEDLQAQLIARLVAVLLLAHGHDAHNKTLAEIARSLGSRGPFAMMGVATTTVAPGRPAPGPLGWLGRRVRAGEHGLGDPADCLNRATALARQLLVDDQYWTLAAPRDVETPPFVHAFLMPFKLRDGRFAPLAANSRAWQTAEMPHASTPLVASGAGGVALQGGGYRCLVGCLYGLDVHTVLPGEALDESVTVMESR